jgi:hypothetical protein
MLNICEISRRSLPCAAVSHVNNAAHSTNWLWLWLTWTRTCTCLLRCTVCTVVLSCNCTVLKTARALSSTVVFSTFLHTAQCIRQTEAVNQYAHDQTVSQLAAQCDRRIVLMLREIASNSGRNSAGEKQHERV